MLNQMTSSEKPVRMQGLNSSRLTSPRATSQNTKILLGFFVILAWSWGLCRARTFPPIARACQLCQGTSGSLKSQQLLCCLCIFLCCQELNWEAVRLSCTCGMMQRAWRVKENKGKLWCSLSPTQLSVGKAWLFLAWFIIWTLALLFQEDPRETRATREKPLLLSVGH